MPQVMSQSSQTVIRYEARSAPCRKTLSAWPRRYRDRRPETGECPKSAVGACHHAVRPEHRCEPTPASWATASGCSAKFVVLSRTPGMRIFILRDFICSVSEYCPFMGVARVLTFQTKHNRHVCSSERGTPYPWKYRKYAGLHNSPSKYAP